MNYEQLKEHEHILYGIAMYYIMEWCDKDTIDEAKADFKKIMTAYEPD